MDKTDSNDAIFPSAGDDAIIAKKCRVESPSYQLAYADESFLLRDELRAVRLQLEMD